VKRLVNEENRMSKILLIAKNSDYFKECTVQLRLRGYQVVVDENVMEGLREISVFGVQCIVWDVKANDPARGRKFQAIKRYHRYTPLILIDSDKSPYLQELDGNTFFMMNDSTVDELVARVAALAGRPTVYKDSSSEQEVEFIE
jgi:DNA-binding NtrC family response regulator